MLNIKNTLDGYLKNVEVIGNTIQNENDLADIRSVGDKVEGQELYKVDIVSCGKNLFNMSNMEITGSNCSVTNNGGILTIQPNSYNNKNYAVCLSINIKAGTYFYTGTATSSTQFRSGGGQGEVVFNLASGTDRVVKLSKDTDCIVLNFLAISSGVITFDLNSIQIEVGTVATPYEPYQENKLEILSPVQIEKVGDVADRIIYKDGVWGVEKNITTLTINGEETWLYDGFSKGYYTHLPNLIPDATIAITSKYLGVPVINSIGQCHLGGNEGNKNGNLVINHDDGVIGATAFRKYITSNNAIVKYPTSKPQFIPLPHDQQVKLRTFAGQTNISFLTEIPGQIKAQVPKSLGATVATHTEQISNLSKELDRVNKLEESTVSTVETVSNFTTVRETSSGYFEDIKLEGKSLVNLNQYIENDLVLTIPETKFYNQLSVCDLSKIKLNTTYTLLFDIEMIENNSTWELGKNTLMSFGQGDTKHNIMAHPVKMSLSNNGTNGGGYSCNVYQHNAITFNIQELNSMGNNYLAIRPMVCKQLGTGESIKYKMSNIILLEGDYTNNPPKYFEGLMSVGQDVGEVSVASSNSDETQLNKKPLLYYNPTTETWEKPILREWDTIEKHSDGKYYYHKRSGEVVLNGSENWVKNSSQLIDRGTIFYLVIDDISGYSKTICDKFMQGTGVSNNEIFTNHVNRIYIVSNIVQDVEGFKSWLQANPTTVVYQLVQEEVYECTNIDLMTYSGETNYIINSGAITPKSMLKVHSNISNVVKLLQEKVSLLESTFISGLKYMLAGDMYSLATILYPEDFTQEDNIEQDIMVIPE